MFVLVHCSGKDITAALKECDTVIKGEVVVGSQHHFYMETLSAAATPTVSYVNAAMPRLRSQHHVLIF
jgi:xanthine dehydrogenase molybdopterin-binding subunit B